MKEWGEEGKRMGRDPRPQRRQQGTRLAASPGGSGLSYLLVVARKRGLSIGVRLSVRLSLGRRLLRAAASEG